LVRRYQLILNGRSCKKNSKEKENQSQPVRVKKEKLSGKLSMITTEEGRE
jgi:hypothetical protein